MSSTVTAFLAGAQVAHGERAAVARMIADRYPDAPILVFEDGSGRVTDLDWRQGTGAETPRGAGRPRLGVQSREVTLLPRQWDWLSRRPGGASATLRRLVDEAIRKGRSERDRKDAAYHFMQAACGDMPGYEEALRALYRSDDAAFQVLIAGWPADVRSYVDKLLSDRHPGEQGAG